MGDIFASLAALFERVGIPYVWIEPRFTADIDFTVQTDIDAITQLTGALTAGFSR